MRDELPGVSARHESKAAAIRHVVRWATDIMDRRAAGEVITNAELLEFQRSKVDKLARLASLPESVGTRAEEALAAARARLAEMEDAQLL